MRATVLCALLLTCTASLFAAGFPAAVEGDFIVRDFRFGSGESLAEVRLHYATVGSPRRDENAHVRNAVLLLHGTGGSLHQFLNDHFAGVHGDPKTQKKMLYDLSPIHKLDRVTASMIVIHGANDTNVPVVEAEQVVSGLKGRNVPVEYILFPDEGHGWRKTPNRIRSAVAITRFFAEKLK